MSKNVQELAEELGIDKNELAAMINGMSLGLMGVTGSTILTPMDVERIKKKHEADKVASQVPAEEPEKAAAAGPVRRRAKAADGAIAPVRRRRKKVEEEDELEVASATVVRRRAPAAASEDGPVRSRRKVVGGDSSEPKAVAEKARAESEPEKRKKITGSTTPVSQPVEKTEEKVEKKAPSAKPAEVKAAVVKAPSEKPVVAEKAGKAEKAGSEDKSAEVSALVAKAPVETSVAPKAPVEEVTAPVAESTPAEKKKEPAASKEKEGGSSKEGSTPSRRSRSSKSSREGYAAKVVHRPTSNSNKKDKKPIDVEPIQQQPRRRVSAAAKLDAQRAEQEAAVQASVEEPKVEQKAVAPAATGSKRGESKSKENATIVQRSAPKITPQEDTTRVRAKIKSRPEPVPAPDEIEAIVAAETGAGKPSSRRRSTSARKKAGATIVKKMDKSVVLDRLSAEGKDFTPGPKRQGQRTSGRHAESGRRSRKRVVEGTDLYGASARRKARKAQKTKKKPQKTKITEAAEHKRVIRIEDAITVGDLAQQMGVKVGLVSLKLLDAGMNATINTTIDYETAAIIAEEFNHTVENVAFDISKFYDTEPDPEETLEPRAPVVTVMGHVDHGKTSLLDAIRSSTVASGEAGGITQHIGAYQVKTDAGLITFLDTPGHEAFTALRARGAKATDITVLVVAADDGVMPQTVEAINHSQDAGVPIVVAVNKIDKPGANVERVKQALTEYNLVAEEWGGTTLFVEVSAKTHTNIDELIEMIMLQAEIEELRANPNRDAQGLVIEAQLDVGRGSVATVLVQRGTLHQGDIIVSGQFYGKVRTMCNERGKLLDVALPSQPVEITGLSGVPEAGEPFFVVQEEKDAKRICQHVIEQRRKEKLAARAREGSAMSLEDLSAMIKEGQLKELKVILKGDVQGSVEAIKQAFSKLGNDEVGVSVIHSAVGGITENDVSLAASSEKGAVVVGFNVRPDNRAQIMAEKYGVKILTHSIIYDAIEQIRILLEGMLEPLIEEETIGTAEVRDIFVAPKVGTVAGCYVTDGVVRRGAKARVVRDSKVIYTSTIESLRRFKDNVNEVKTGFECGLSVTNYNDVRLGDLIECYILKEVAAKLV